MEAETKIRFTAINDMGRDLKQFTTLTDACVFGERERGYVHIIDNETGDTVREFYDGRRYLPNQGFAPKSTAEVPTVNVKVSENDANNFVTMLVDSGWGACMNVPDEGVLYEHEDVAGYLFLIVKEDE